VTKDQIERRAECRMNTLDSVYISGNMTEADYKKEVQAIEQWVKNTRWISWTAHV
jgi:hypothetical protein